jgi:hypothetical protein
MNEDKAAVALRIIIRAEIGATPGDPQSLRNVNTTIFPDGGLCFVTSVRSLYQLDKGSSAVADNVLIVAPGSGPGRWIRLSQSSEATSLVEIVGTAANTATTSGSADFVPVSTASWAFEPAGVPAGWVLVPGGGLLVYLGTQTVRALVTFTGSVDEAGETGGLVWAGIAQNGDLVGVDPATSFLPGTQGSTVAGAGAPTIFSVQRTVVLAPSDVLQIVLGTSSGSDTVLVRATLSAQLE